MIYHPAVDTPALTVAHRAARLGALSDPLRLRIVDALTGCDRSPVELGRRLDVESNLLAHHLVVLEQAGLIERSRSSGDGRRRYVHLLSAALDGLLIRPVPTARPALFVCTRNSARSQLAAAVWRDVTGSPASSAGTHPADRVHPGAVAAARRSRLDIGQQGPRRLNEVPATADLVVTVCDQAHEELAPPDTWLHWSIPDPVPTGTAAAFDATVTELRSRVSGLHGGGVER